MGIHGFSSLSQNSVEFETGPFINVDIGEVTFLTHREVLLAWVDTNGADTISISTMENLLLKGVDINDLVGVTRREDELVLPEEVKVVSFVRILTVNSEELEGSLGESRVFEGLLRVVLRIELVVGHVKDLDNFLHLLLNDLLLVLTCLLSRLLILVVHNI